MPFYLVYVSTATILFTRADLDRLLEQCRTTNTERDVTGALLYRDGTFMQVLEGGRAVVEELYSTIWGDPRHYDVTFITSGHTESRQFNDWSMAFRDFDLGSSDFADEYQAFVTYHRNANREPAVLAASGDRPTLARRLLNTFRSSLTPS